MNNVGKLMIMTPFRTFMHYFFLHFSFQYAFNDTLGYNFIKKLNQKNYGLTNYHKTPNYNIQYLESAFHFDCVNLC